MYCFVCPHLPSIGQTLHANYFGSVLVLFTKSVSKQLQFNRTRQALTVTTAVLSVQQYCNNELVSEMLFNYCMSSLHILYDVFIQENVKPNFNQTTEALNFKDNIYYKIMLIGALNLLNSPNYSPIQYFPT